MLLGAHLSISEGFPSVIDAATKLEATAAQIFSHSPSRWQMGEIFTEDVTEFAAKWSESQVGYVVVHTMYLLNLATPDDYLYERSISGLIHEAERASLLGIDHVVLHVGSHRGSGLDAGIARVSNALDRALSAPVFSDNPTMKLLLEDTAGAGTTVGSSFSEIGTIIDRLDNPVQVGVCLDTCHAFAAGHDIRSTEDVEGTLAQFDEQIGLSNLELIHLNDSKHPLSSNKDRHEHIGQGHIGLDGFDAIINHKALKDLPFILETPKEIDGRTDADKINLDKLRTLRAN